MLLFPGPLWPGVIVVMRLPSMLQIELFNHLIARKPLILCKHMTNINGKCQSGGCTAGYKGDSCQETKVKQFD